MMDKEEEKYLFWLCSVSGLGITAIRRLRECFPDARELYIMPEEKIEKAGVLKRKEKDILMQSRDTLKWEREWEDAIKREIRFVSFFHEEYPEALRHIYQPPKKLMVKGRLPEPERTAVSIVGARDCTAYGRDMARLFGCRLAEAGVQIISGMAIGIDGWGHQGALEGGGDTFAVLGSGVEVCYPSCHRALYESIRNHGGILSEYPIWAKAYPAFFPMRNRIISGLSHGILVVEAREKSGSLITADAALEQGKDVFVIPGRIGDELSAGCNRLIRQGAIPVLSPMDILEYYGIVPEKELAVTGMEQKILEYIGSKPVYIDWLADALQMSQTKLFKALLGLKRKGWIEESAKGYFIKKI